MAAGHVQECDVLVVGSGVAGMSAAITAASRGLKVILTEKASYYGGTTARSGGWLWVPGTHLAKAYGHNEEPDQALTYIRDQAGPNFDEARVRSFLTNGPKAVEFFMAKTAVQFDMPLTFPDYHAEAPGAAQGGRSFVTRPYDARELGPLLKTLGPVLPELTVFGVTIGSGKDIIHFMRVTRSVQSAWYVTKRLAKHFAEVRRYGRGMTLTNGNALAARLAKSAADLGVALWLSAPAVDLTRDGERVTGAVIERGGEKVTVKARCGVVLASGGFPHNVERLKRTYPHIKAGQKHFSPTPQTNVGDGAAMAEKVGGIFDDTLPNAAAWTPMSLVPRKDGSTGIFPHFIDRAKPGVIAVDQDGRRFTNEANSYHDVVQAMIKASEGKSEAACWLVADHRAIRRYGLGFVKPFPLPLGSHLRNGYLKKGASIADLAAQINVNAAVLEGTIRQYNDGAQFGRDPQFGRGSKAYNRYQGDALHGPNPCVEPLKTGPFYAIKLVPGDLGSFMGIKTNEHGQVLASQGSPIPGLYAAGNDAASIMGGEYNGAGITLGPGLTFGYVAANHIADASAGHLDNAAIKGRVALVQ
ncbi:FAD-dependent oxidoreductase [Paraburkholderia youngii]|uniref:FAD-dependent oxidoreductase n=1 Tax=Paraburkholderia youngii TaxID=2782701 RepID=A0A7Y6MXX4_9BURK|nr:FAD-dependent oxidoreductase [Paraburkholderia youngii]NUX98879.1 FAD-dependent oxidoreductase [Paraburkholderia youngii]